MLILKKIPAKEQSPGDQNADAVFLGWMNNCDEEAFPLYNITAYDHPSYGSTVSGETLRVMNLQIPETPPPKIT